MTYMQEAYYTDIIPINNFDSEWYAKLCWLACVFTVRSHRVVWRRTSFLPADNSPKSDCVRRYSSLSTMALRYAGIRNYGWLLY